MPSPADRTLTFAVVSGAARAEQRLEELCRELERGLSALPAPLPFPVRPRVLPSYAALKGEVEADRAHVIWAPPRVAIDLEDAGLAAIGLCCTRGGHAYYHAALFTRHAGSLDKLEDLRGCHAAWVDTDSAAGYLVPRRMLRTAGLDPDTLFGKQSFLGTHGRVASAVLAGEADVGATYVSLDPRTGRPVSAGWLDAGAGINAAFILAQSSPIPSDAIVLSNRLSADLRAALVEQVRALPSSQPEAVAKLLGADGFALPEAAHFDTLRELFAG